MKILVTRPTEAAGPLLVALAASGHHALHEPLLRIVPEPGATLDLAGAQALLLTSAAGARAAAALTARRDIPVLAVGRPTATVATALGFDDVTPAAGNGAALVDLVVETCDPAQGRLVHASGAEIAVDLGEALRAHGFACTRSIVYRAVAAEALSPACRVALERREIDAAMFHSPRMARTFVTLARSAGLGATCSSIRALALSPAIAHALDGIAWERILIAAASEDAAMLALLAPAEGDAV